ncbi:hypothetical protein [Acanthopleuribacter pedis]|uniref:Uncharacterized protein n=1 Tax=Acanthopleuribacter pedis TaxID=442870 RepID=A0A8J7U703_9BACT|nr:hypothetical protein [Acanthopleuribacter pedis]MBO1323297.1 hypothetical protein [Acanthopleuribacter pedis]
MSQDTFYQHLVQLTALDASVVVPEATVNAAQAIFEPKAKPSFANLFVLRPLQQALVRDAGIKKWFYDLPNGFYLSLEQTTDKSGIHLHGFINGIDESEVFLYGTESVGRTRIENGVFDFVSLESGEYSLSFWQGEERYWVNKLYLKEWN